MKKYRNSMFLSLTFLIIVGMLFGYIPRSYAQDSQVWTEPINLSNAGSSTNPQIVIDAEGTIHVVWIDAFDGYKYANSTDGVEWTSPIAVTFPFSPEDDSLPVFLADKEGGIYALWISNLYSLYYSKLAPGSDFKSGWSGRNQLDSSVLAFEAVISSKGILHVGYVSALGTDVHPAGMYYLQLNESNRSAAINLYSSQYFRSLPPENANVNIAVNETDEDELETVYMVWDERPQKRIFMAKSIDEGENWGKELQILGPEDLTGTTIPFNIDLGVLDEQILLTWQLGQPGDQCTQYSAWSTDGGLNFEPPVKVSDQFFYCPQSSEFVLFEEDLSVMLFNVLDDISLSAWNGSVWSVPYNQNEIATFINPVTFDSIIFGCQKTAFNDSTLYVVGCDNGIGGDIWFSSRSLGALDEWFPSSELWSTTTEVTSVDQKISDLASVADAQNNIHMFWVQTPLLDTGNATIQYARWSGDDWSSPVPILSGLDGSPVQLEVAAGAQSRLILTWVDSKTGDLLFSWANAERANIASEWNAPQYIPSPSQENSSPHILVDAAGRVFVSYAISINEYRGIYIVESDDIGSTWTQPLRAFDAASVGWEMVDHPTISLTGDGRLHMLFRRYALYAEQRRSLGLYYCQSLDGGVTWSNPEVVSENSVLWSRIVGYDRSTVHRVWQEDEKSQLISFHQVSQDSGSTWSSPAVISMINTDMSLNAQTIDTAGNLYFLQLTSEDNLIMLDHIWNGSGWNSEKPQDLFILDRVVPSSVTTNITSTGNFLVSVSVDYPYLTDELRFEISSVKKSLTLPEAVEASYIANLPSVEPTTASATILAEETPAVLPSFTPALPLAGLNQPPSFFARNKNLIGLLLLGGILILIFFLYLPVSKKKVN